MLIEAQLEMLNSDDWDQLMDYEMPALEEKLTSQDIILTSHVLLSYNLVTDEISYQTVRRQGQ